MNPLSKLQSEAVLEFDKKFFFNRGKLKGFMKPSIDGSNIKQFLSDQIQKAYSKGREEIEPFKTFLLNEGYSEEAIDLIGYKPKL